MTTVGHTLVGLSLGALAVPRDWRRRHRVHGFVAFAVLASAPDLPLPGWGHDRYEVSHSVFVTAAILAALLALLAARPGSGARGGRWLPGLGAAAWLSHLLLDSFYAHGRGLRMFWPFAPDAALALPIPWFHVVPTAQTPGGLLAIFATEAACYGPLLVLALWWRSRAPAARGTRIRPAP